MDINLRRVKTVGGMRSPVGDGSLECQPVDRESVCELVQWTCLGRGDTGVVRRFPVQFTGLSKAHLDRRLDTGRVVDLRANTTAAGRSSGCGRCSATTAAATTTRSPSARTPTRQESDITGTRPRPWPKVPPRGCLRFVRPSSTLPKNATQSLANRLPFMFKVTTQYADPTPSRRSADESPLFSLMFSLENAPVNFTLSCNGERLEIPSIYVNGPLVEVKEDGVTGVRLPDQDGVQLPKRGTQ